MNNKKDKIKFLIYGILLGLITGGVSVYLIDEFNLPVIEKIKYITIPATYIKNIAKPLFSSSKDETEKADDNKSDNLTTDTIADNESAQKNDSLTMSVEPNNKSQKDSINSKKNSEERKAISDEQTDIADKDIVLAKDELLFTKEILVDDINAKNEEERDDRLAVILTDKETEQKKADKLHIEFWKSPVNYEGYKMSNNTLLIFGIDDFELANFIYCNGQVYLNFLSNYYHLENTESFKPFAKIVNTKLIRQLHEAQISH